MKTKITKQELGVDVTTVLDNAVEHLADYVRQPYSGPVDAGSTAAAYTLTTDPALAAYVDGLPVTIIPNVDCEANPTLNWSGKGAVPLVKVDGTAFATGELKAGKPYSFVRVGSNFFIRSSGKSIKSVQSGTVTLAGLTTTVPINEVDLNKAVLLISTFPDLNITEVPKALVNAFLTDGTTITIERATTDTYSVSVSWQVIEFENVKSVQRGIVTPAAYVTDVTINQVDVSKSLIVLTGLKSASSPTSWQLGLRHMLVEAYLSTSTNLVIHTGYAYTKNVYWQIVEFN